MFNFKHTCSITDTSDLMSFIIPSKYFHYFLYFTCFSAIPSLFYFPFYSNPYLTISFVIISLIISICFPLYAVICYFVHSVPCYFIGAVHLFNLFSVDWVITDDDLICLSVSMSQPGCLLILFMTALLVTSTCLAIDSIN